MPAFGQLGGAHDRAPRDVQLLVIREGKRSHFSVKRWTLPPADGIGRRRFQVLTACAHRGPALWARQASAADPKSSRLCEVPHTCLSPVGV